MLNDRDCNEEGPSLPQQCHTVLPGQPAGANVALCVRGEAGVRLTRIDVGDHEAAQRVVQAFNESLGIDPATEHAMLAGCLVGWDTELADPDYLRRTDPRFMQGGRGPDGRLLH